MQYALDAIEDERLARPDRLVLISPMIGITGLRPLRRHRRLARGLPGLRQGRLARRCCPSSSRSSTTRSRSTAPASRSSSPGRSRPRSTRLARDDRLGGLPPILTFQSVIDFTVSTRAIITALYAQLPANGSELVLFDLNRTIKFGPLLSSRRRRGAQPGPAAAAAPVPDHDHRQRGPGSDAMVERVTEAGGATETDAPARPHLPARGVLPLPRRPAVPGRRRALRHGAGPRADDFGINLGAWPPAASAAP